MKCAKGDFLIPLSGWLGTRAETPLPLLPSSSVWLWLLPCEQDAKQVWKCQANRFPAPFRAGSGNELSGESSDSDLVPES